MIGFENYLKNLNKINCWTTLILNAIYTLKTKLCFNNSCKYSTQFYKMANVNMLIVTWRLAVGEGCP